MAGKSVFFRNRPDSAVLLSWADAGLYIRLEIYAPTPPETDL